MEKLLTIGMCNYDDFHGVWFSIQALKMYHQLVKDGEVELIVIDNNPKSKHAEAIKGLMNWNKEIKYIPYDKKQSTSNRNLIFQNATGKYTISMDCHVLFPTGSLDALLKYYMKNPHCKDIVQGPMLYDDLKGCATHFKPTWGGDMYGQWARDDKGLETKQPFDIPMQGLGVFSCETENWLGFSKLFRGFGGEEGYIHEKFRLNGGRSICLPEFKWLHRFGRPDGVKYPLRLEDRIWNYFTGWMELKQTPKDPFIQDVYQNFLPRYLGGQNTRVHILDDLLEQACKRALKRKITTEEIEYIKHNNKPTQAQEPQPT